MATLTACMSSYNYGRYVGHALEAMLAQTRPPDEIIVLDDASTDGSAEIIEKIAKRSPTVRFYRNEVNVGPEKVGLFLTSQVRGDYMYGGAADDLVLPGFFEKTMALLEAHPQAGVCSADRITMDMENRLLGGDRQGLSPRPAFLTPAQVVASCRRTNACLHGAISIFKTSALRDVGGIMPKLQWYQDWFYSFAIAFRYGMCYVPEQLVAVRINMESYSGRAWQDLPLQRPIVNYLLDFLKEEQNRDLTRAFQQSGVLAFCPGILSIILRRPEHWDYLSLPLLRRVLTSNITRPVMRFGARLSTPKMKGIFRWLLRRPFREASHALPILKDT